MVKLANVQVYPINNVPDHLTHECSELGKTLCLEMEELLKDKDPNIVLGAINFFHSAMLKSCVSDDPEQQTKAAKLAAVALIKNVYFLNGLNFKEK